ncbi:MAG TPA: GAP family protein [Candidatus Nanopelagicales bacterium]
MSSLSALVVAVPLGLAAAVSPVMLAEQMVLVGQPNGRRAATAYALGTASVLVALSGVLLVLGRSVSLPRAPRLDTALDLVLGGLLLVLAWWLARRGRRAGPGGPMKRRQAAMRPVEAFGFGVVSMATNFTSLPIVLVAEKDIAASSSPWSVKALAVLVLVGLTTAPAWAPVLAAALPGRGSQAALEAVADFTAREGRRLATAALALIGALLVLRGALHATGYWS